MYKITFYAMSYGVGFAGLFALLGWWANTHPQWNTWLQKLAPIQILLGFFCFVGGGLALFYPLGTEQFIGDLIPGGMALILGFWLAFHYMKPEIPILTGLSHRLTPYQLPLGVLAVGAAVMHHFFWGTKNFF
jgi:hypothetical protein